MLETSLLKKQLMKTYKDRYLDKLRELSKEKERFIVTQKWCKFEAEPIHANLEFLKEETYNDKNVMVLYSSKTNKSSFIYKKANGFYQEQFLNNKSNALRNLKTKKRIHFVSDLDLLLNRDIKIENYDIVNIVGNVVVPRYPHSINMISNNIIENAKKTSFILTVDNTSDEMYNEDNSIVSDVEKDELCDYISHITYVDIQKDKKGFDIDYTYEVILSNMLNYGVFDTLKEMYVMPYRSDPQPNINVYSDIRKYERVYKNSYDHVRCNDVKEFIIRNFVAPLRGDLISVFDDMVKQKQSEIELNKANCHYANVFACYIIYCIIKGQKLTVKWDDFNLEHDLHDVQIIPKDVFEHRKKKFIKFI